MTLSFLNQVSSQTFWTILFFIDLFMITFVAIYGFYAYYKRLSELKKIQIDTHKKSEEILRETQDKAKEILERVEHKADEILTHSELFKNDLNSAFQKSLKGSSQKYLEMVEVQSKRFISDYENLLTSVKNQSLEKAGKALDLIEQDIQKSLIESKGTFKAEVMRSLTEALQEIESFKQMEMDTIDRDIDKVVVQIAKEVLRTSITPKDHKKMVLQALDKAKEQGMFFL